jgi:hypothetical protein
MKIIKKLLGLDKVEANIKVAEQMLAEAEAKQKLAEEATVAAQQREELSKLSPKDRATRKKEPWVGVLDTHVNKDNVRNGFFELDWNEQFVLKLRQEGYGADGDKDEEVVDRWFRELCANVVVDGDFGGAVTTGSLDPASIKKNL